MNEHGLNRPKVIMISKVTVSYARFHESGLEYLCNNGWDVEIWTVGIIASIGGCFDKECKSCTMVHFDTYLEYDRAVRENKDTSLFYFTSCSIDPYLFISIENYKCRYFVQGRRSETPKNKITEPYYEPEVPNWKQKTKNWLKRVGEEKGQYLKNKVVEYKNRQYSKTHKPVPIAEYLPEMVFTTNDLSLRAMLEDKRNDWLRSCNVIFVPSMQYDYYLEEERKGGNVSEEFILLIASGLGFEYEGLRKVVYKEKIYSPDVNERFLRRMEKMLDLMEEHYGLPVIVAGHPRGIYNGYDFGGRKVLFGRTPELAKKCKVCITTITYAMTFPIIYNKRLLFYYNESLKQSVLWKTTYTAYLNELGLKGINLDDDESLDKPWECEEVIEADQRNKFIRNYHNVLSPGNSMFGELLEVSIMQNGNK